MQLTHEALEEIRYNIKISLRAREAHQHALTAVLTLLEASESSTSVTTIADVSLVLFSHPGCCRVHLKIHPAPHLARTVNLPYLSLCVRPLYGVLACSLLTFQVAVDTLEAAQRIAGRPRSGRTSLFPTVQVSNLQMLTNVSSLLLWIPGVIAHHSERQSPETVLESKVGSSICNLPRLD